jgi:hypothetical protein
MESSETINNITAYLQGNIYVTLGLVLVSILLILRKPKIFITIVVIALLMFGIFSMLSDVTETGEEHRNEMAEKKILKD